MMTFPPSAGSISNVPLSESPYSLPVVVVRTRRRRGPHTVLSAFSMPPVVTEDVEYGGALRRTQGSKRSPVSVHSGRVAQIRVLDRGHVRRHHPADVAGRNVVQPFHELFSGAVAPQVQ